MTLEIRPPGLIAVYSVETDPKGIRAFFSGEAQGQRIEINLFFSEEECEKFLEAVAYARRKWGEIQSRI